MDDLPLFDRVMLAIVASIIVLIPIIYLTGVIVLVPTR